MGVLSAAAVAEIKARGSIDNIDVLALRRDCGDGRITFDEAEIIFSLNDACPLQDPAWTDWFVETLTEFIVDQAEPDGYLTSDNATWLVAHIAKEGRVETLTEMDLVLSVLDRARWSPISLVRFALDQVKHAIVSAAGPLRCGRLLAPSVVSEADVDLLRRIMCSFDADLPVTRPEAEVLLDIDAAAAAGENHPSWRDLLVKALANCVLAASGCTTPPRRLALARDPWLDRRGPLSLDRKVVGIGFGLKCLFGGYRRLSDAERDIARLRRQKIEIVTREPLAKAEAGWLAARIDGNARVSSNARALLSFLKGESPALHPGLQALVDKAAAAS